MLYDFFSVSACSLGALALLKGKSPVHITVKGPSGKSMKMKVSYVVTNGVDACVCNNYMAYATHAERDLSIHFDCNCRKLIAVEPDIVKKLFSTVASIMNGNSGVDLYLEEI